MKAFFVGAACCALAACQPGTTPILSKVARPSASTATTSGPMRPSGAAFDVNQKVTDFATCASVGVVIAATEPAQCVHEGVTYTLQTS